MLFALGIIILLFAAVWGFTKSSFIFGFNLSDKGAIGEVIGGVTAPITSLIGSAIIFYAFWEQVKANKLQREANELIRQQWEYDTYVRIFNDVQSERTNLRYTSRALGNEILIGEGGVGVLIENERTEPVQYEGSEAISEFISQIPLLLNQPFIGILSDIAFILEDLRSLIQEIEGSSLTIERKLFLLRRIDRFYTAKLGPQMIQISGGIGVAENRFNYEKSTITLIQHEIEEMKRFINDSKPKAN